MQTVTLGRLKLAKYQQPLHPYSNVSSTVDQEQELPRKLAVYGLVRLRLLSSEIDPQVMKPFEKVDLNNVIKLMLLKV